MTTLVIVMLIAMSVFTIYALFCPPTPEAIRACIVGLYLFTVMTLLLPMKPSSVESVEVPQVKIDFHTDQKENHNGY